MTIRVVLDLPWYWLPVLALACTVGWLAGGDMYVALKRRVVTARMRRRSA
jgi:hypothetical protein